MLEQPLIAESSATPSSARRASRRDPAFPTAANPDVIVLGGGANALSIARSLGRRGVAVHAINTPDEYVHNSRFARPLRAAGKGPEQWTEYLTGPKSDPLEGSVLLAASDAGLELIAKNRPALERKFLLDESNPRAQLAMLNKLETYQMAAAAGVATPRFWLVGARSSLDVLRPELVYPLIVKPQYSHRFEARFGFKFLVVQNFDELVAALATVEAAGIEALLVEKIEGPDDRLCSYYTYLDESGMPLFNFTKRIIRRYPVNMGPACYHVTADVPEIREPALRLFRHAGLRGLANVEFKYDARDGRHKLIECNARFTAANCLLADCGLDLARFVYDRARGAATPALPSSHPERRLWYPLDDFKAFWALRRRGELTLGGWLKSLLHRQTFPFFEWRDPWPTVVHECRRLKRNLSSRK